MRAIFCKPLPFTIADATSSTYEAKNLANDEPGLVFRGSSLTATYAIAQTDGSPIDVIALVGTNLKGANTIRVRMGSSTGVVNGGSAPVDVVVSAAAGGAKGTGALFLHTLSSPVTHVFIRIDFNGSGNSDGYVEASRLVLGLAADCLGVDVGAEITFGNATKSRLDPKRAKPLWKVTISGFTTDEFYNVWFPFLMDVSDQRGFLFIPDDTSPHMQREALFGSMNTFAKSVRTNSDYNTIDITVETIL